MSTRPLPPLSNIPPEIACVSDYRGFAKQRVTAANWAYIDGTAGDGLTAENNQKAFQKLTLTTRVLQTLEPCHTRLTLLGMPLEHPFLIAPIAYQKLAHEQGELATVVGAGATQTPMVVSMQASVLWDDIAAQAQAPLWLQPYLPAKQPDHIKRLVERAQECGFKALVVTADAPVSGNRNAEQRAGFQLPKSISAVNLNDFLLPAAQAHPDSGSGPLFASGLLAQAPTWDDLADLIRQSPLPVILKGVLSAEDAKKAQNIGCAGIIVSNHGGRTLDGLPASIDALPAIVDAVGPHWPILLDGGIRRGSDAFKAIALGAKAVLIGRPIVWALASAGAAGVAHSIQLLRAELEVCMALTGCPSLDAIQSSSIY